MLKVYLLESGGRSGREKSVVFTPGVANKELVLSLDLVWPTTALEKNFLIPRDANRKEHIIWWTLKWR
jgi:hypothetical protein